MQTFSVYFLRLFFFLGSVSHSIFLIPKYSVARGRSRTPLVQKMFHVSLRQVGFRPLTQSKIGTIQRRLAWSLRKDDTRILREFHPFFCVWGLGKKLTKMVRRSHHSELLAKDHVRCCRIAQVAIINTSLAYWLRSMCSICSS